jgi:hypothetical protein
MRDQSEGVFLMKAYKSSYIQAFFVVRTYCLAPLFFNTKRYKWELLYLLCEPRPLTPQNMNYKSKYTDQKK